MRITSPAARRPARPRPHPPRRHGLPALTWAVAAESSFDIVSKINHQEVDNALNQAAKEIGTRFDFRGVGASIAWSGDQAVEIKANSEERANAVLDVFKDKLVRRQVSLKVLDADEPKLSGKEYRLGVGAEGGHLPGRRQEDLQDHPGRGAQGRPRPGPGRGAAGLARRRTSCRTLIRADQGQGTRPRAPVRQLPLTPGRGRRGLKTPPWRTGGSPRSRWAAAAPPG